MIRDVDHIKLGKLGAPQPMTNQKKIVLDRISDSELVNMFRNQLAYFLKSLQTLFNHKNPSNLQFKLLFSQFVTCLDQYQPYLSLCPFLSNLVEAGEHLLEIQGCHILAKERCFQRVLDTIPFEEMKDYSSIICRARIGVLVSHVVVALNFDPLIRTRTSIETLQKQ